MHGTGHAPKHTWQGIWKVEQEWSWMDYSVTLMALQFTTCSLTKRTYFAHKSVYLCVSLQAHGNLYNETMKISFWSRQRFPVLVGSLETENGTAWILWLEMESAFPPTWQRKPPELSELRSAKFPWYLTTQKTREPLPYTLKNSWGHTTFIDFVLKNVQLVDLNVTGKYKQFFNSLNGVLVSSQ